MSGRVRKSPLREIGSEPDYRFSLANERTFLAWIRTSLALLAAGVAVVALVPTFAIPGGRLALGIALIALALVLAPLSYLRWERNERAMRLGTSLPRARVPQLLALGLGVVALIALTFVLASV